MIAWKVVGPECNGGEGGRGGRYQEGRPAVELAFELDFPPTLVARLLLQDLLALTRQVPPSPPPPPTPDTQPITCCPTTLHPHIS